jgi:hypothetical protein
VAGVASESLSVAAAKARLRAVVSDLEMAALAPMEPRRAVLLALLAGILAGTSPDSRKVLARILLGLLFDTD